MQEFEDHPLIDELVSSSHGVMYEIEINQSAEKIWPYLSGVKLGQWTNHQYYPLLGESVSEGEVFTGFPLESGEEVTYPAYRFKVIKAIPYRCHMLRIAVRDRAESIERLAVYGITLLTQKGKSTLLTNVTTLSTDSDVHPAELKQLEKKQLDFLSESYPKLKALVENDSE